MKEIHAAWVDLDIDSDHSNADFGLPNRDAYEDEIEGISPGPAPHQAHKYVLVNDYHEQGNYLPGYADFQMALPYEPAQIQFTPIVIEFDPCALPVPLDQVTFTLTYPDSNPLLVTSNRMSQGGMTTNLWEWSVPNGTLRVWKKDIGAARNPTNILDGGDFIPSGANVPLAKVGLPGIVTLYVEGIRPSTTLGTTPIRLQINGSGLQGCTIDDLIHCTPIRVGVNIDTFNNSGFSESVHESFGEDHYEEYIDGTNHIGKLVAVGDDDRDLDGIVDFADGYGLLGLPSSEVNAQAQFVPIRFTIPQPIDLQRARIRLTYSDSDPMLVTSNAVAGFRLPSDGKKLRIWKKPGNQARAGQFLASGEYTAEAFGFTDGVRSLTYYLEAVCPSEAPGDLRVLFEVQPDERASFMAADAVRVTAIRLGLTPDFNRDGKIDEEDRMLLSLKGQFRVWINDDRDEGYWGLHAQEDSPKDSYIEIH